MLLNSTGSSNIALGDSAGFSYTTLSNRMYLGARDTTGTTGGIYFDRTPAKRWGKWMGTLKVTDIPADAAPDSVLTVVDGLIKRAAFPTGGSGTVTSISQGTGMLNSADPITTTGTIGVDTSKVVMFTDTAATGGKIATSYALTTGLAGKQAAGSYVTSVGATSPVASSGGTTPTVSINTDTLTAWHTKQNQGATAYSWGNPAGVYEPIIDPVPIAPGNYYAKHDGAGQTGWQEFPAIPAAYDTLTNPWKYLSGNTVQRGTGNVGIGITNPSYGLHLVGTAYVNGRLTTADTAVIPKVFASSQMDIITNSTSGFVMHGYNNPMPVAWRRYNGTYSSPTKVLSGNSLGRFNFGGYNGSAMTFSKARIDVIATQDFDLGNGTRMTFSTTPNGSTTLADRLIIDQTGYVGVGVVPTTYIDINGDKFRVRTAKTPSSATDTGNAGDICWDASYIYICTASNTWKRVAISTW